MTVASFAFGHLLIVFINVLWMGVRAFVVVFLGFISVFVSMQGS